MSALRDLRTAARLDPVATRPLEQLGDVNYALRDHARAAGRYDAYVQLDQQMIDETERASWRGQFP